MPVEITPPAACRNLEAMKLDVNQLRYLSRDDFRVLQAVELGQRNVSTSRSCLFAVDVPDV